MPRMLLSAKKVRERREALGMTQLEAARAVGWGISQPWWRLEQRDSDPRVSTAWNIAKALHCRLDELLVERLDRRKRKLKRGGTDTTVNRAG